MATDQQVLHRVDLEIVEGFAEFAAENPDGVQLGLGARSTDDQRSLRRYVGDRDRSSEAIMEEPMATAEQPRKESSNGGS